MTDQAALNQALLAAHRADDGVALVALYTQAGDLAEARGDVNAACFFLTHAYIFALEAGAEAASELNGRLADHGREVRQAF